MNKGVWHRHRDRLHRERERDTVVAHHNIPIRWGFFWNSSDKASSKAKISTQVGRCRGEACQQA